MSDLENIKVEDRMVKDYIWYDTCFKRRKRKMLFKIYLRNAK